MADEMYRYEDVCYSTGGYEYSTGYRVAIELRSFRITKKTSKGVWIETLDDKDKFILLKARKRYACPTKEEAMTSFIARKRRQLKILKAQMNRVQCALDAVPK